MDAQVNQGVGKRVAAIDLGTVTSRLSCATVVGPRVLSSRKHSMITDLGEGVDATGAFCDAAIERVASACATYVDEARAFGAEAACCTLTSAARDASNAEVLLGRLRDLGLAPQVIPGELEARLTFFGVASDFPGEDIAVADSGGGSTEIALGSLPAGAGSLSLDHVRSLDIGCRRMTERFFHGDPPAPEDIEAASAWAHEVFASFWDGFADRPSRLVAVGGTVTTMVAMTHELEVYDPAFVHLHELLLDEVERVIDRIKVMPVSEIAQLKGIQPKRARVMLAGSINIRELMRAGGYTSLTVSENSLLAGLAATIGEALEGAGTTIGWTPELSRF